MYSGGTIIRVPKETSTSFPRKRESRLQILRSSRRMTVSLGHINSIFTQGIKYCVPIFNPLPPPPFSPACRQAGPPKIAGRRGGGAVLLFIFFFGFAGGHFAAADPPANQTLSDDQLLETIQRASFEYFLKETSRRTGLVADRANNFERGVVNAPASIAAVGFGLTAFCVAAKRGWVDEPYAKELARRTLLFFLTDAPAEHGFFYHFLNRETGVRVKNSELSPIDTALFLMGAFFAADYFDDPDLRKMAVKIYERVDFPWMLNHGETLALSWSPEQGFSKYRWDHYCESMILYLLAMGSPAHPIPAASWKAIRRPAGSYHGYRLLEMPPLFTHQYAHNWIDFRGKNDGFADYFQNSVQATLAQRAFAIDQSRNFKSYGPDVWGLTASDGPYGYKAYGAPPGWATHDGTIAPTACGSSIIFTPKESMACLRHIYEYFKERLWGRYGFSDAFNLDQDWFDDQVLAIDQGALLLIIENYRSGLIWKVMEENPYIQDGMKKAGFVPGTIQLPWPDPPIYRAPYRAGGMEIDGYLKDWAGMAPLKMDKKYLESGQISGDKDLGADIRFSWDENALYFSAKVTDQDLIAKRSGRNIWMDDDLEIFVDPDGDGFVWKNPRDFQLGFRMDPGQSGSVSVWSWFQKSEDPSVTRQVVARGNSYAGGYVIEGAIRWSFLGMRPGANAVVRLSVGLHDVDRDRSETKLQWFFRSEKELQRFELGRIILSESSGINAGQTKLFQLE